MKLLLPMLLAACCTLTAAAQPQWSYSFRMDTAGTKPTLEVALSFKGHASGRTELLLPDAWGSEHELYRFVSALEVQGGGARLEARKDSLHRLVRHRPGADLTVRYRLQQDWSGPYENGKHFRGVLRWNWIRLSGYTLFVRPATPDDQTVRLQLSWKGLPARWTIANSLHCGSRAWQGRLRAGDLENSFFVAGDFRLHEMTVDGRPLRFAIRGDWNFPDAELLRRAARIISAERAFWKDQGEPYYLVALAPTDGRASIAGNSMFQSFLIDMSPEVPVDVSLLSILAHEYFHRWIGIDLTLVGPENDQKWFSEGFTEYYTFKMLWRTGLIDTTEYVTQLNRLFHAYHTSPLAREPRSFLSAHYWDNPYSQRLPYVKGASFAYWLDATISSASGGRQSLDDLLFSLRAAFRAGKDINDSLLVQTAQAMGVADMRDVFQKTIVDGGPVPSAEHPALGGYRISTETVHPFTLGFQTGSLRKGGSVEGVVAESAAWQAGLRNGMVLQGWSITNNDTSRPVTLKVEDGKGGLQTISYVPKAAVGIPVPQLKAVR
ncbi:hypothetical protein [Flaviaesturariibacter amylovorans]|uniref:Peptidase M61 catalytic domain-containing protein n=1 Tax=Flaviaesturariibacter amylovorans TaxID=1084520 RepID=A0ABP8HN50_9BACT